MSLNIKNEETCRLADELAKLFGETKTGAVTIALMGPSPASTEHGDLFYDDRGLPK